MEYIPQESYDYILNKYHRQDLPFDPHKRFIRNDALFREDSGLSPEAIEAGILTQDAQLVHLPHPVRKAKAFAYVLANTRISCDKRDPFPAIHMIDRPLHRTLINPWKKEVFTRIIPRVEEKRVFMLDNGIATIRPDFDHSVPVWERIYRLGFCGLLAESQAAKNARETLTPEQSAFYEGIAITYTAILDFIGRLEAEAASRSHTALSEALSALQCRPPETFYEALLTNYLYFMLCEHIEGMQVRSLCHFDRLLYPYYQKDLDRGIPEQQLTQTLACYFLQFSAIGNYWNQPVFLGGNREDETTICNPLTYRFLEVYDALGLYCPKVQIKISDSTPKDLILKALDMIRRGRNSIVFLSDATIRKALIRDGASPEVARLCDIKGCYEYSPEGAVVTEMNYVNLLKPLEYALHKGCDGISGVFTGLESPDLETFQSFEAFFEEYKRQLTYLVEQVIAVVNGFEDYLAHINPQSMLSATCETALTRSKDSLRGGATENTTIMEFGFMADAVDSLANIKKYVFDQKLLTLPRLRELLDSNFAGNESLRVQLLADRDKYGNNKPLPDALAREIAELLCRLVCGRANAPQRGGRWNLGFHVARQSYEQGKKTAASANGRPMGQELSKNLSASMGMNREGATAAILSVTKFDATAFTGDASLDLGLLPGAVRGADGLEAMYGLLMTFIKRGGHAIHMNVFDAQTLRAAQKEPEKYRDLQIRVCGWNVLWNNISPEEQEGFIRQAESLI